MTWADCRFRDLLSLHAPNLAPEVQEGYVCDLCAMLRREWFVDPRQASMYAVVECWAEWVRRKGGIRNVQAGDE